MLDWLLPSPAERRLLEGRRLSGPMPWVVAIMSFSMMIVAATGLALANAAAKVSQSVDQRYSVQVPGGGGEVARIVSTLRSAPGVTTTEAVPEKQLRETLERWLGPAAESQELPIPALVNFDIAPNADLEVIRERVMQIAPEASILGHSETLRPLLASLRSLQWLALGLVLLLGTAAAAAVVLATRGALDTHRFTIEVLHGVGATDLQVTRLFQRKIAINSLTGSIAGAGAAAVVLLVLFSNSGLVGDLTGGLALSPAHFLALALLPIVLAVLATAVARITVLSALRQAL